MEFQIRMGMGMAARICMYVYRYTYRPSLSFGWTYDQALGAERIFRVDEKKKKRKRRLLLVTVWFVARGARKKG